MTKTRWFTDVAPVHLGVYETMLVYEDGCVDIEVCFSRWSEAGWMDSAYSVWDATDEIYLSRFKKVWRGLVEKPE